MYLLPAPRASWFALSVCLGMLTGSAGNVFAQPAGTAVYVWRADLGGWLDTSRNLVWGYSLTDSINSTYQYSSAQSAAAQYPVLLAGQADYLLGRAEYCEMRAAELAETDPARSQAYAALAVTYGQDADAFFNAALNAGQFSNWRTPTLSEFQNAWSKGLFSRGANGFNLDMSPAVGYQAGYGGPHWTSDPANKKKQAPSFSISDGRSSLVSVTSVLRALVVRTHTP